MYSPLYCSSGGVSVCLSYTILPPFLHVSLIALVPTHFLFCAYFSQVLCVFFLFLQITASLSHCLWYVSLCFFLLFPAERGTEAASQPNYDWKLCPARKGGHHTGCRSTTTRCMNTIIWINVLVSSTDALAVEYLFKNTFCSLHFVTAV